MFLRQVKQMSTCNAKENKTVFVLSMNDVKERVYSYIDDTQRRNNKPWDEKFFATVSKSRVHGQSGNDQRKQSQDKIEYLG